MIKKIISPPYSIGLIAMILIAAMLVVLNRPDGDDSHVSGNSVATERLHGHSIYKNRDNNSLLESVRKDMADPGSITAREQEISQLITSKKPTWEVAQELLRLMPNSTESEQVLIASNLSNLAEGEQFNEMVKHLSNPAIGKKAKDEIFSAIFLCEPKQTASLLIQVLENGVEEFALESEQTLSILLQADHGRDIAAWRSELDRSLAILEGNKTE